jgi:hypothetical protein
MSKFQPVTSKVGLDALDLKGMTKEEKKAARKAAKIREKNRASIEWLSVWLRQLKKHFVDYGLILDPEEEEGPEDMPAEEEKDGTKPSGGVVRGIFSGLGGLFRKPERSESSLSNTSKASGGLFGRFRKRKDSKGSVDTTHDHDGISETGESKKSELNRTDSTKSSQAATGAGAGGTMKDEPSQRIKALRSLEAVPETITDEEIKRLDDMAFLAAENRRVAQQYLFLFKTLRQGHPKDIMHFDEDTPDIDLLESLDLGFDYQRCILSFQQAAHEISLLVILEWSYIGLIDAKMREEIQFKKDRNTTEEKEEEEQNMRKSRRVMVEKGAIIDYSTLPRIMHYPRIGVTDSKLYEFAFECYLGLGTALLRRSDFFAKAIRHIEKQFGYFQSCMDIAQRVDDDLYDLVWDWFIREREQLSSALRKKNETEGTNLSLPSMGTSPMSPNKGGKGVASPFGSFGQSPRGIGGGPKTKKLPQLIAEQEKERKAAAKAAKGAKDGPKSVGNSGPTTPGSVPRFSDAPANKSEEGKGVMLNKLGGKQSSGNLSENASATPSASASPLQSPVGSRPLSRQAPADPTASSSSSSSSSSLSPQRIKACIRYLKESRRHMLIMANKALDAASEYLRMRGWHPDSKDFYPGGRCVEIGAEHLRSRAVSCCFVHGRVLQGLGAYERAVSEFRSSKILQSSFKPGTLELVKTLLALGDFSAPRTLLNGLISRECKISDPTMEDAVAIYQSDQVIGLLFVYTSMFLYRIQEQDVCSAAQWRTFDVRPDGLLRRHKKNIDHVEGMSEFAKIRRKEELRQKRILETTQSRTVLMDNVNTIMNRYRNRLAESVTMLAEEDAEIFGTPRSNASSPRKAGSPRKADAKSGGKGSPETKKNTGPSLF